MVFGAQDDDAIVSALVNFAVRLDDNGDGSQ